MLFYLQRRTCDRFLHHCVVGVGIGVAKDSVFFLWNTDTFTAGISHLIAAAVIEKLTSVSAVQRFDKEGEPFEVYPNIFVTATRGETAPGPEGCLSIPGWRGDVLRYRDIDIEYTSPKTLKDTTERVQGFSAVIFQHECDHLDGVLYIDKVVEGTLHQRQQ